ncbi:hypothetical protein VCHA47P369_170009 [Vibrio chagasii]|nr:hypothetical protein VCHA47P369_170009 [Vibrio chagasii]
MHKVPTAEVIWGEDDVMTLALFKMDLISHL